MSKLSVIVPVYNTEKYLRECIDSILAQTFTDFELILIDDGSTDKSGSICDEYSQSDVRIQVIHQNNGGVTAARKRGVEAAVGEYISFVDSDDWIEPNMYQDMLIQADTYNADMILCDMVTETQKNRTVIHSSNLAGLFASEQLNQQIYANMLFDFSRNVPGLSLSLCNKLIRRALAKPVFAEFPNDVTFGEDALGSLMCLLRSNRIFIMENAPFYHYRQTDEFLVREQSVSLLPRLSSFARNAQIQFLRHGFDGAAQLSAYIAQVSLYCMRQILLFNKECAMRNRFQIVADYFNEPHIHAMLRKAETLFSDEKIKSKIRMINRKRFLPLFLCFCGKEIVLRAKRHLPCK